MRKFSTYAVAVLLMIMVVAALLLTSACSKEEEFPSWNLTADGSVTARFSDNGKHGFILTVEGNGASPQSRSKRGSPPSATTLLPNVRSNRSFCPGAWFPSGKSLFRRTRRYAHIRR